MFSPGIKRPRHILVNRVDAMGDVILALPVCGLIKKYYPECKVTFLGRSYTKSIAMACVHVDGFVNRDDWNSMTAQQISDSLRAQEFDIVLHLLPDKVTISACGNAKIKLRVGAMNR